MEFLCPVCGKPFFPDEQWVFRNMKNKYVCSYTCARASLEIVKDNKRQYYSFNVEVPYEVIVSTELLFSALYKKGYRTKEEWLFTKLRELIYDEDRR